MPPIFFGKDEQALAIEERFRKAWNQADVPLTASRFMDEARATVATIKIGGSGVSQKGSYFHPPGARTRRLFRHLR